MIKKFLILFFFILFFFSFLVYSDSNGIWSEVSDIRGGIFGLDENDYTTHYTFINRVLFNKSLNVTGYVSSSYPILDNHSATKKYFDERIKFLSEGMISCAENGKIYDGNNCIYAKGVDIEPNSFSFNNVTGVQFDSLVESNEVIFNGFDVILNFRITSNSTYATIIKNDIDVGVYTTVVSGDRVKLRIMSLNDFELTSTLNYNIEGDERIWIVKTKLDIQVSCKAWRDIGGAINNGIYTIDPDADGENEPFDVYCDMTTYGGGWTLVGKMNTANTWSKASGSNLWTQNNVLNENDLTLNNSNSKYNSYNTVEVKEIMAITDGGDDYFIVEVPNIHSNMIDLITTAPRNYGVATKPPRSGVHRYGYSNGVAATDFRVNPQSFEDGWRSGYVWIGTARETGGSCSMADREAAGLGVYHGTATSCNGYLWGSWGVKGPSYASMWVR